MHTGTRKLIRDLRAKYPDVMPAGEMRYDALLEFIPLFQVFTPRAYPPATQKYSRISVTSAIPPPAVAVRVYTNPASDGVIRKTFPCPTRS